MKITIDLYKKIIKINELIFITYNFNKGSMNGQIGVLNNSRIGIKLIKRTFSTMEVLYSEPSLTIKNDNRVIKLFYYRPEGVLNENIINNLGRLLDILFNKKVKLELIKLSYPFLNREIYAKYLRLNSVRYPFRTLKKSMFKKRGIIEMSSLKTESKTPTEIIGIKVQISGRLETERSRPRKTVSTAHVGSTKSNNASIIEDFGSYTGKNAHGAHTVKVWITEKTHLFS